jgi:hypothetical protein
VDRRRVHRGLPSRRSPEVGDVISAVIIGVTDSFDEFDPEFVIDKAVELVTRYPDAAPVVAQIIRTYIEVLASLLDDYNILREAS